MRLVGMRVWQLKEDDLVGDFNRGGLKMFDFSCKEKSTEMTILHLTCKDPSLLLLTELFQKTPCNPCALDTQLKVPHQYIPMIFVSSRKLLNHWEKKEFIVRLKIETFDNFDVFSEFEDEKSQGMVSKDSFSALPPHLRRSHQPSGSFQYTQGYSLPKTQTHKKFLEVFKTSRCQSNKSNSSQIYTAQEQGEKALPENLLSRDMTESDMQIQSQLSAKSIRLPASSIQRLVQFQRSTRGIMLGPKEKIQPKAKGRKLGTMIASLRFPKNTATPSKHGTTLQNEKDAGIIACIQQEFDRIFVYATGLTADVKGLLQKTHEASKVVNLAAAMYRLECWIRIYQAGKAADKPTFIETSEQIKAYRGLLNALNLVLVGLLHGGAICSFLRLWKSHLNFVLQLNSCGRFTSSLQASVDELALLLKEREGLPPRASYSDLEKLKVSYSESSNLLIKQNFRISSTSFYL